MAACSFSINPYSILAVLMFRLLFHYSCTKSTKAEQRCVHVTAGPCPPNADSTWETAVQVSTDWHSSVALDALDVRLAGTLGTSYSS